MVRTATSPAAEDETDLSKVRMQMPMFEALVRGYLSGAGNFLDDVELSHLAFSGKLITLEIGIRFLTDYLEGDIYFKTRYPDHNLDRCRTQLALVAHIEKQEPEMKRSVDAIRKEQACERGRELKNSPACIDGIPIHSTQPQKNPCDS